MATFCEYYCLNITVSMNIIVSINSYSDLSIIKNTARIYYHRQALKKKLKLMGGAMKFFSKKLQDHEVFSPMVP